MHYNIEEVKKKITIHNDENIKGFFNEYNWMSNFYKSEVEYEGIKYPSSENAYQSAKARNIPDRIKFVNITPSQSKKLGRIVELRSDWESVKLKVMYDVVLDKFTRNPYLGYKLLETGNKYLEETNYWNDTVWGVCNNVGENNLGKILMEVRKKLK